MVDSCGLQESLNVSKEMTSRSSIISTHWRQVVNVKGPAADASCTIDYPALPPFRLNVALPPPASQNHSTRRAFGFPAQWPRGPESSPPTGRGLVEEDLSFAPHRESRWPRSAALPLDSPCPLGHRPADPLAHGRGHRRRTGMISDVRHYNLLLIDGHNAIHHPYLDS